MEAIAAKQKMWNSEPAGRNWANPVASEPAHATSVVNPTITRPPAGEAWLTRSTFTVQAAPMTTTNSTPALACERSRSRCPGTRPKMPVKAPKVAKTARSSRSRPKSTTSGRKTPRPQRTPIHGSLSPGPNVSSRRRVNESSTGPPGLLSAYTL